MKIGDWCKGSTAYFTFSVLEINSNIFMQWVPLVEVRFLHPRQIKRETYSKIYVLKHEFLGFHKKMFPVGLVKTRFLTRMLLSLRLSLKWPESWLVSNSRTRMPMEKGSFASLYRKETETGIIGV